MRNHLKRSTWSVILAVVGIAAIAAAIATTATAKATRAKAAASLPTITLLSGVGPSSLDPSQDYSTQGAEINSLVYTGLLTYAHGSGLTSTKLIPGLATALPKISPNGKTYTLTLRKGLKFSNGDPVVASDFTYSMERSASIPWGGVSTFVTPYVKGAAAYASHKAKTISGISTNNATGKIVIHLTTAYGPFANVLAFPSFGLMDPKTAPMPFKVQATNPPAGVGPYMVTNIVPNQGFSVVVNPDFGHIPGIPAPKVNVNEKISSNVEANALSVLQNNADVFDWADTLPGSLIPQIHAKAASRFKQVNLGGSTYYVFMNATKPPFSSQLAREAVVTGLNEGAFNRLGSGTLDPGCFFLPPGIPGHPTHASCPYGNPAKNGNLKKARALVKQSGMANTPITVYSELRVPRQQWMTYYASYLKQIGFKNVTIKQIADATYFTTIGKSKAVDPQTGFADWNEDFPNPVDFYGVLLDGNAITTTNNFNFGQDKDPYVDSQVAKLGPVPTTKISKVVGQWQKLEEYVAKKAYVGVFGYQTFPFFTSSRIKVNYTTDIYGWDLLGLQVK